MFMLSEKEIKKEFKEKIQKDPEKYFPVKTLKSLDFKRYKCKSCPNYFWSIEKKDFCGEPLCSGGFRFINNPVTKNKLDYIEVWKKFSEVHKKLGYTPIKRYPSVARWNPTIEFTIASIAAFQPYVVSGEVEPPANPLVIPQFSLRFNDIDNVGLTGHFTGFVMMGQHAFVKPEKYDINKYLKDHLTWLNKGLGLKNKDITIHEDAWAGGGNLGNSLEFFSGGLEISNQVYMQYAINDSKINELKIKVLDMGQGQERAAWFTQGTSSSYEAAFPKVIKYLKQQTGLKADEDLMKKFLPYSSYLNVDEVKNIDSMWKKISQNLKLKEDDLKNEILPLAALYSVAEHTRTLLVAITDSALPSNVAGGYNLRTIFRRAESFMEKYFWNIDLNKLIELHADYLKPLFPELKENLKDVEEILKNEKSKYQATKQKSRQIIVKLMEKEIAEKDLLTLYDSYGITPETIKEEAIKLKKEIKIPPDFYAMISELHEKKEQKHQTIKEETLDLNNLPETELLFYKNEKEVNFEAKVLKVIGNKVILDRTLFYSTSGGQLHDTGHLGRYEVIDVFKQNSIIVHVIKENPEFRINDIIKGKIEWARRYQLMQHHTTTHIINSAAKKVLGNHVNQAGAFKDTHKARIDITHFQPLTDEEIKNIEDEANSIVKKKIPVKKSFMSRAEAEKKYGMMIYQGGVPIGKELRIVNILGIDVEACGGTHLDSTEEAGLIKIIKSNKISDNIVRIEFKSGKAAEAEIHHEKDVLEGISKLLDCKKSQVPARAEELFEKWKRIVKKKKFTKDDFILRSEKEEKNSDDEILKKTANILKTQPEFVSKTVKRFLDEIKKINN